MRYYTQGSKISIFSERELTDYLQDRASQMQAQVEGEAEAYLLNVNETEYIKHLVDRYSVENLQIYPDKVTVKAYEKEIPADWFPRSFHVRRGGTYRKTVIKYFLPFEGDQALLYCYPNPRQMWTRDIVVEDGCICFEIVDFRGNPEDIKQEAQGYINPITRQLEHVRKQVNAFNSSLDSRAKRAFDARKQQHLRKNDLVAQLGVPVRKKADTQKTFSVPAPQIKNKIQIRKPVVQEAGFRPEPTLDESTYTSILRIIHDVGRQFERMPSTYAGKEEEHLRDHLLLFLEPNFEGSATGETFNKSGKTDILLRYEGSNVFIAECKFWRGQKGFTKSINQLLGYLTWRDSKAAVILFVENKDFSAVLNQIEQVASEHPSYLGFSGKQDETWFSFRFHLEGDPNREVQTAVMLYHFPK